MKRLIALMIAGLVAVILTGCGEQAPKQTDIKPEATVSEPVKAETTTPNAEPAKPADESNAPASTAPAQ